MIKQAYIHEYAQGKLEPEHQDILNVLKEKNIPFKLFTNKQLDRRRLELNRETLVVGEHPVIRKVLKYMEIETRHEDCYPESIRQFLGRRIWTSTVRNIIDNSYGEKLGEGVFVKPRRSTKEFTGFVMKVPEDQLQFGSISTQMEVYCSEIIEIESEYRVFVNESKIVGIKHYSGSENIKPDNKLIEDCINTLEQAKEGTRGYGIDFGVDNKGRTLLIEWKDGYSLGSYGLDRQIYTNLIISRWEELMTEYREM